MKNFKIEIPQGYKIDKEKSTFENIVFKLAKKQLPKRWEELKLIDGYYYNVHSQLNLASEYSTVAENYNVFATENQAESHGKAAAKLSQLMAVYNDGWIADWGDDNQKKSTILYAHRELVVRGCNIYKEFLTFKSEELASEFLENFREDIETYFNF
jgi:hypothetical protein